MLTHILLYASLILTNEILKYITEIEKNRYRASAVKLPRSVANRLRKNLAKLNISDPEFYKLSEEEQDEILAKDEIFDIEEDEIEVESEKK